MSKKFTGWPRATALAALIGTLLGMLGGAVTASPALA